MVVSFKKALVLASIGIVQIPQMTAAQPVTLGQSSKRDKTYAPETSVQATPASISGRPVKPIILTPEQQKAPWPRIEEEAADQKSMMNVEPPPLQALISVDHRLDPFGLDAGFSEAVSLRNVVDAIINRNLDIKNSAAANQVGRYTYLNALSKFLPNPTAGYQRIYLNGALTLPGGGNSAASAAASANPASAAAASQANKLNLTGWFSVAHVGFNWTPVQGGYNIFNSMNQYHSYRATRAQSAGTINDALLTGAQRFYQLMLNDALLQIRIQAVNTSQESLRQNVDLERAGLATNLDVLQARTQLSRDRQNLIDQQGTRRTSALQLASLLNLSLAQDLIPCEQHVHKVRLISKDLCVADLLKLAIDNRPELKQYEELRKAAKAAIGTATSPLLPSLTFSANEYWFGPKLSQATPLFFMSMGLNWTLGGLGTTDYTNIQAAKWRAREAQINANRALLNVMEQVRTAYINSLTTERRIDETDDEVASALEELRLARLRMEHGLGTNLDVLTAQRDLTQAYIDKAQAIVQYNIAQAQLLHDVGMINAERLVASRPVGSRM